MSLVNYQKYAGLHAEITDRLLEKLDFVKFKPQKILDLGAATGYSTKKLHGIFPKAEIIAVDQIEELLLPTRWRWRAPQSVCTDYLKLPFKTQSLDMIFVNISVLWPSHIKNAFQEFYRLLKPQGMLLFATLGVDTLFELRHSFAKADHYSHVHEFLDMHDIGDLLTSLQFSDPVMDMEKLVVNYPSVQQLIKDLRVFHVSELLENKRTALMGKNCWQQMLSTYSQIAAQHQHKYPVTLEIIYGHAWLPHYKSKQSAVNGEVVIPIDRISILNKEIHYGEDKEVE